MAGHDPRATEANGVLSERSESKDLKPYRQAKAVSPKPREDPHRPERGEGGRPLAPLRLAILLGELGLSSQSSLERRAVPARPSDSITVRSARGLWRTGRRNAQCDEADNTRHSLNVPVVSTHDRSLVM
jgi:hypothetical protein